MTSNFGQILAGALESSNTNISIEMINLIKTQQAFNGNARILTKQCGSNKKVDELN